MFIFLNDNYIKICYYKYEILYRSGGIIMAYKIVTISRQYGSGGRAVGKKLAEALGYSFYDNALVEKVVEKTGMTEEFIKEAGEYSPFASIFSYGLVGRDRGGSSLEDMVYAEQRKVILDIVEKENCVFVGRCSDAILDVRDDCFNVFITGDPEDKIERIKGYNACTEKEAKKLMRDTDKKRKLHYDYYTDRKWGVADNYDLCLNTSTLGIDKCVELIMQAIK